MSQQHELCEKGSNRGQFTWVLVGQDDNIGFHFKSKGLYVEKSHDRFMASEMFAFLLCAKQMYECNSWNKEPGWEVEWCSEQKEMLAMEGEEKRNL